ncbi:hypothetical protein [Nostoc sp. DedQUE09]|uniref:hypothetical protein n=1 Tax=Nostoc sp. DedQUE09 TaxID=3075394 RepID=UPI002AD50C6B|nr:hypothetical protein [Nostoc sp. DedQUE09]MDZ7951117.1 hypothetical protein [Nostoc sp. DedQUE09]
MPQFYLQSAGGFLGRIAGQRQIVVGSSGYWQPYFNLLCHFCGIVLVRSDRILPNEFSSPVLVLGVIWCAGFSSYGFISPLSDHSMANTQAF